MISAGELAMLRAESNKLLPDTCVIQRVTRTADAYGGGADTWADLATVACRVGPAAGARFQQSEPMVADRTVQQADYVVTLPAETDVTAKDRIFWNSRTLQVTSILPRSWEFVRRVSCTEAT